jgi:PAS domain S-box-containing protein
LSVTGGLRKLVERPFAVSRVKLVAWSLVGITLAMMAVVLVLGWQASSKVQEIVLSDFNRQQLILARHASARIQNAVNSLKRELQVLSIAPVVQYLEQPSMRKRLVNTYDTLKEKSVLSIRFVTDDAVFVVDGAGYREAAVSKTERDFLKWAAGSRGRVLVGAASAAVRDSGKLAMDMVIAVRKVSTDEVHPLPPKTLTGAMIFSVDATDIAGDVTRDIVSGKTGYAWVIDNRGAFLYHPEPSFTGKNAFEARRKKRAAISFEQINMIQKEQMIAGREGMSWYVSGWHRSEDMTMKKLIAYSPVFIDDDRKDHLWSVAVVAPVSEVKNAIHDIQIRQFMMEGMFLAILAIGAVAILRVMFTWSDALERVVEARTTELKKTVRQYSSLVENANDLIFSLDRRYSFLSINIFGYHFLHKSPRDILGKPLESVFGPTNRELLEKTVSDVFELFSSKQVTCSLNVDDTERWLSLNFCCLVDDGGDVYAVLGIARDVTESVRMEEKMRQTEKLAAMGTMVAGVAHEINNPLTVILGFSDILKEKFPADSETHELLSLIEKQGNKARRVVDGLLSFTRTSEGRQEAVDINDAMEDILNLIKNNLFVKQITVVRELSSGLPPVYAQHDELKQIFLNLVINAEHAMKDKGGTLTVSTRQTQGGGGVEVRFSDTGCGIDKKHRLKIFDPLFTTKEVGEGTGLGLSVSFGIITKYGGTITFETRTTEESVKTGTTFIVTLPAMIP